MITTPWSRLRRWQGLRALSAFMNPKTATVQNGDYTLNPDFYVMKHFSNAVQRGAVRLGAAGHWTADALTFRRP